MLRPYTTHHTSHITCITRYYISPTLEGVHKVEASSHVVQPVRDLGMGKGEVGLQTLPGVFVLKRIKVTKEDTGRIVGDFLECPAVEIEREEIRMKCARACGADVVAKEERE